MRHPRLHAEQKATVATSSYRAQVTLLPTEQRLRAVGSHCSEELHPGDRAQWQLKVIRPRLVLHESICAWSVNSSSAIGYCTLVLHSSTAP